MKEKPLDVPQQLMAGVGGKIMRQGLGEDYLNCPCPTCKKLRKLHKKTAPYVAMLDSLLSVKELDADKRTEGN